MKQWYMDNAKAEQETAANCRLSEALPQSLPADHSGLSLMHCGAICKYHRALLWHIAADWLLRRLRSVKQAPLRFLVLEALDARA